VWLFVFVSDSLAQTIRYLPIPPPVVSTLPPCRASRTIANEESTGFMLVFHTTILANLRNSSTKEVQVWFDIAADSTFPSKDVSEFNPSNIARTIRMTLYSRLCFGNAINFDGQTDTLFTSSHYISNQMLAISQLMPQFRLFDDSTYFIRAFTYIVTDSAIIISPPSKVFSLRPDTQFDQIALSHIQPNSIRLSVLFSEQHILSTPRPVIDSILVEAATDSLFRRPHQLMLPLYRLLRQFSTMFYTYDNPLAFTNLLPATQYFFRARPFFQGVPTRPYFKSFAQSTAAIPVEKISIGSNAIDLLKLRLSKI
jgi:hypothetical protein